MQPYGILVNSTDSFEDCWLPFFTLFSTYWPSCEARVYLNSEVKAFTYPALGIVSVKNGLTGGSWSDCLLAGLDRVEEDAVFYLQEDYFLYAPVDVAFLAQLYGLFVDHDLDCLHATDRSTSGPFDKETFSPLVWGIAPGAPYRVSLQPAFWKKEVLQGLLRPGRKAWRFEHDWNQEPEGQPERIYRPGAIDAEGERPKIFPYVCTGVMGGRWNRAVRSVFRENHVTVDYRRRGFYRPKGFVDGYSYRAKWAVKDVLDSVFGYRWPL